MEGECNGQESHWEWWRIELICLYLKNKELRKRAGWTQSELARRWDVTRAAVSKIEKGKNIPSLLGCQRLAEIFDISLNELTGEPLVSSVDIKDEVTAFLREFGDIRDLTKEDQHLIQLLVKRLSKKKLIIK